MTQAPTAARWEGRDASQWAQLWQVPRLVVLESVDSTNNVARRLAAAGAPAGTLVLTDHQTAGRGRMGRSWSDAPASAILFSLVLRPLQSDAPGTAPVRVGMAVASALRDVTGLDVRIKWPNDLVYGGHKVAGVLCEAVSAGTDVSIVAGVGINVNQERDDFAPTIRDSAISLAEAAGRRLDRADLMAAIVTSLLPLAGHALLPLGAAELTAFAAIDALDGRAVIVSEPAAEGVARGIDPDGALRLETSSGTVRVTNATVRLRATTSATSIRQP